MQEKQREVIDQMVGGSGGRAGAGSAGGAPAATSEDEDEDEGGDAAWTEPLASEAFCQYDGRGKFLPVWLELSPDGSLDVAKI